MRPMMRMKQSLADPCIFYKPNKDNKTVLIVICFKDDTLLVGTKEEIEWSKQGIKKCFKYTYLGKLCKHLGVWYEEKYYENGELYLEATMPNMVNDIIKLIKSQEHKEIAPTSGQVTQLIQKCIKRSWKKIMYLACKLFAEGSNGAREMA
jgi:hypothetical protein